MEHKGGHPIPDITMYGMCKGGDADTRYIHTYTTVELLILAEKR